MRDKSYLEKYINRDNLLEITRGLDSDIGVFDQYDQVFESGQADDRTEGIEAATAVIYDALWPEGLSKQKVAEGTGLNQSVGRERSDNRIDTALDAMEISLNYSDGRSALNRAYDTLNEVNSRVVRD